MCEHQHNQEHEKELTQMEPKDLSELSHFDIKIEVRAMGIECIVRTTDPLDCVTVAGYVIAALRKQGFEPTVLILP